MQVPTVKIINPANNGYIVINKDDFKSNFHKLYDDVKAKTDIVIEVPVKKPARKKPGRPRKKVAK